MRDATIHQITEPDEPALDTPTSNFSVEATSGGGLTIYVDQVPGGIRLTPAQTTLLKTMLRILGGN